jgi:indoleamine 2,3-dioxygenase
MEYAQSYALYNYMRKDPKKGLEYSNLDLIRTFSGMPSEYGFILVHVAMVSHSGKQVKHTVGALEALSQGDRDAFNEELRGILNALKNINETMDTMWMHSTPGDYIKFRTFIMGTKNQPMFPKGVIYEGVSTEPTFYRGESGANDSIVPTADNFLQLTSQMPDNPLTQILRDFRTYRPANHNEWLAWLEKEAAALDVRSFAQQDPKSAGNYCLL